MTRIYISLGSNIEREHHIRAGLDALHAEFGELQVSRVFESEAVGFNGRPFYNLVVGADTNLPLATLCQRLRAMEFAHGREPDAKKFAPRTLDLDLLLYGDLVCDEPLVLPRGRYPGLIHASMGARAVSSGRAPSPSLTSSVSGQGRRQTISLHDSGMTEPIESQTRNRRNKMLKPPSEYIFSADTLANSFAP